MRISRGRKTVKTSEWLTAIDEQTVIEHTREAIARYKAPKRVIVVDALERNSYGKVIKDILRARYADLFVG